jgi:hypothetical protein
MMKMTLKARVTLVKQMQDTLCAEVDNMVGKGPGRFTKRQAEDIKAGMKDGVRYAVCQLVSLEEVSE